MNKGFENEKRLEIKSKVADELNSWMTNVKMKREHELDKITKNKPNKDIDNEDIQTPIITQTIKKYNSRFSQAKKILREVIHGNKNII